MPISTEEAAQIARAAGLTLTDASALRNLADTREQAETLARQFQRLNRSTLDARRQSLNDSIEAKSRQHLEIRARTDHNGHIQPRPGEPPAAIPTTSAATPAPPPATAFQSETPPATGELTLAERVALAEAAGDRETAQLLKSQMTMEARRRMNGA